MPRLRHLQIPTTSVTAPIEVKSDTLQQLSDLLRCARLKGAMQFEAVTNVLESGPLN
jgi:hypothetical protein